MGRDSPHIGAGYMNAMRFKAKRAVVTGASSGIGRAIAGRLSAEGAELIAVGRDMGRLELLRGELALSGGRVECISCDLSMEENRASLCDSISRLWERVDVLINAAGLACIRPVEGNTTALWQQLLEVNVVAPSDMLSRLIPVLVRGSSVVNISSVAGIKASPGSSIYASAKAALVSFTETAAVELAHRGIRVNAVLPGMVRTRMMDNMLNYFTDEQKAQLERRHLLGYGTPEDIAASVAFIASSEAGWITGCALVIDGGFTLI